MRHSLIITLLLSLFSASTALGQVGENEDVLLRQVGKDAKKQLLKDLSAGEIAALKAMQVNGNYSSIVQNGNGHKALIQQAGTGNVVELTQNGTNHVYEGYIEGNENLDSITQSGSNHTLKQELRANAHIYKITQSGSGHTLEQYETGTVQPIPVEITQKGSGMQVTITNGSAGLTPKN